MDRRAACRRATPASLGSDSLRRRHLRGGGPPLLGSGGRAGRHPAEPGARVPGADCRAARVRCRHVFRLASGKGPHVHAVRHRKHDRREPAADRLRLGGSGGVLLAQDSKESGGAGAVAFHGDFVPDAGDGVLLRHPAQGHALPDRHGGAARHLRVLRRLRVPRGNVGARAGRAVRAAGRATQVPTPVRDGRLVRDRGFDHRPGRRAVRGESPGDGPGLRGGGVHPRPVDRSPGAAIQARASVR